MNMETDPDAPMPPKWQAHAHVINAAPDLLAALAYLLEQTVEHDLAHGLGLTEGEAHARQQAYAAIAKANGRDNL